MLPANSVRDGVIQVLASAVDILAADAHQRERLTRDGGVAVCVSGNRPFESEIHQGRHSTTNLPACVLF